MSVIQRSTKKPPAPARNTVKAAPSAPTNYLDVVIGIFLERLGAVFAAEVIGLPLILDARMGVGILENHPAHRILDLHRRDTLPSFLPNVRVRWCRPLDSSLGLHQSLDRGRGLTDHVLAPLGLLRHAVADVVVEKADGDLLEGVAGRGNLRQDVDAVLVFFDHPLDAPRLAFDPP